MVYLKEVALNNLLTFLKKYGLIIAVVLIAPYFVLTPLFHYETWCAGHDSDGTIFNAWSMVKTLREWPHLPIVWQPDNCGYKGNPYWSFYQPLSNVMIYLMSLITSIFDSNYVFSAMKSAVYLSFLISEIGMFLLLRTILKDLPQKNFISTYGAIIYLLAPYRFIDLYSRNAYSELWVFPWMPFYLLGFYKLFFLKDKKGWILIALATPCLLLSHLMPSFFFILIVHLSFLIFLTVKRNLIGFIKENKKILLWWLIGNIVGGLISSFYVLPAMNVIKYLNGDIIGFDRVSLGNILNHISWCYDMLNPVNFKGAWQVGQLFLLSFAVLNILLLSKRKTTYTDLLVFLNISLILTFTFLMSRTLWEHLPPVLYGLQFSWRLFVIYSLFCSVIVALLIHELNIKIPLLVIFLLFHYYTGERFLHYGGGDVVARHYNTESWLNEHYRKDYTTTNNYSPHSILPKTTDPVLFNFQHADEVGTNEKFSNTFFLNQKPGINILSHKRDGNLFTYKLSLESPAFLVFKQYFYSSWELFIDNKKSKDLYLTEQGYIGFEVPQGKHLVEIRSN
ncbi:MAG: hypothetical protein HY094_08400 [Candidatus Melainabacteria bacterium]|nr:hypothetical protein [Candidatus Melainabacteria bacterium]